MLVFRPGDQSRVASVELLLLKCYSARVDPRVSLSGNRSRGTEIKVEVLTSFDDIDCER